MKLNNNTNESLFKQTVEILRAHIGQINVNAGKQEKWESGKKISIDYPLAELDSQYGGAISECLDALSDNDGIITDSNLVHALNTCLEDVNTVDKVHYKFYLDNLVRFGDVRSEPLYDWQMGYPFRFDQGSKTLSLTVLGIPKRM